MFVIFNNPIVMFIYRVYFFFCVNYVDDVTIDDQRYVFMWSIYIHELELRISHAME